MTKSKKTKTKGVGFTIKKLQQSKSAKKAVSHALGDLGFPIRQIGRVLDLDKKTVARYQKEELSEEWEQFADTVKKVHMQRDFELTQLAAEKLKLRINEAKFFELISLYKTIRDLQKEERPKASLQVNFNNHIEREKQKFIEQ